MHDCQLPKGIESVMFIPGLVISTYGLTAGEDMIPGVLVCDGHKVVHLRPIIAYTFFVAKTITAFDDGQDDVLSLFHITMFKKILGLKHEAFMLPVNRSY